MKARRVAVIGASGQLGSDLVATFERKGDSVAQVEHADLDLETLDPDAVVARLAPLAPDLVVNTAAFHNVEECERAPLRALAVNAAGARSLAMASEALGFVLVHFSTDYVFDGSKGSPYLEDDQPAPLNVYGNSKLSGEHFVRTRASRHFVVRTCGLYGRNPCRAKGGFNFVRTMLRLAQERGEVRVVTDEQVSPTYTADLAEQVARLSDTTAYGVVHAAGQGVCSWYEFAEAIFALTGVPVRLIPAVSADFPHKVRRPTYSGLANMRLRDLQIEVLPPWRESLHKYLSEVVVGPGLASAAPR